MLNPSTADARRDDPTIRRCMGFARTWGYGGVEVVNLFALRATDPSRLRIARDPVGPENDAHIRAVARRSSALVVAWGIHGALRERDAEVLALLSRRAPTHSLGWTKDGHPRHPLYLRRDARLLPYGSVRRSAA